MKLTRLIEEYLDGTLGDEEKQELRQSALRDKKLENLIRLHEEVNESIRDKPFSAFHLLLKKTEYTFFRNTASSEAEPERRIKRSWSGYLLRTAAVLLIFAGIGVALKLTIFRSNDPARLYLQYYMPYDADVISRSVQGKIPAIDSAVMQYSLKEYDGALLRLDHILAQTPANYQAWFYRGLTCMETNQMDEALRSFAAIPVYWNSPFIEHREWYQALALLHQGNEAEAASAFRLISQKGGYYAKKAAKVRKKIKT